MKKLTLITAILLTANLMFAQIINIPDDYPTIQQGIDATNSGDTILVQPGIYYENISVLNQTKTFVLASLYLTTLDTSYVSQTIIDGNLTGGCLRMYNCSSNETKISGFTLQNGFEELGDGGGGFSCFQSNPKLDHLIVRNNEAWKGGGVYVDNYSNTTFEDILITNNTAGYGGGLYLGPGCTTYLKNVIISGNTGSSDGGGILSSSYNLNSTTDLENVIVKENYTGGSGGGIKNKSVMSLKDVIISSNTSVYAGGGLHLYKGPVYLENVTISNNHSKYGGGAYFGNGSIDIQFDATNRCNVYGNTALTGSDFYNLSDDKEIILDTMSVLYPNEYYADPIHTFTFDIQHGMTEQINADLYISPDGDNQNNGLSPEEPLKNIRQAFSLILADELHQNTIHLMEGTYSPSTTDELFPIHCIDYFKISGTSANQVIFDAEELDFVIIMNNDTSINISNITITGGESNVSGLCGGGGISCKRSDDILLENVTIKDNSNTGEGRGGGIGIYASDVCLINSLITNNNCTDNWGQGGGIYVGGNSTVTLLNAILANNECAYGGGICVGGNSTATLLNVTLANNESVSGGAIYNDGNSVIYMKNCISYFNIPDEIYPIFDFGAEYCNINGFAFGLGNINEDPQFVNSGEHPYQLSDGSPCIDTGNPDTTGLNLPYGDIIGNKRIWDGDNNGSAIIDMGAYEFGALPVGIEKKHVRSSEFDVRSYPNPAFNNCTIEFELVKPSRVLIQIYDNMGELLIEPKNQIYSTGQHQVNLNLIDLKDGIYFCRLQIGNEMVTKKIIKVN